MRYFKRYWADMHGDAPDAWGCSWWFFETDTFGVVSRQAVMFEHGPTLRYDGHRWRDEFGMLTDQPLELVEFAAFEITRVEFEQTWGGRSVNG